MQWEGLGLALFHFRLKCMFEDAGKLIRSFFENGAAFSNFIVILVQENQFDEFAGISRRESWSVIIFNNMVTEGTERAYLKSAIRGVGRTMDMWDRRLWWGRAAEDWFCG
jgi:hypothetical protein